MLEEIRILAYDSMYPIESGYNARVMNLAKIAKNIFQKATVYSVDNTQEYHGSHRGVELIQDKKFNDKINKYYYYLKAYFYKNFIPAYSPHAFEDNRPDIIYQTEGPYYYPLFKKQKIKKYILDQHNIYWELHQFSNYYSLKNKAYFKLTSKREKENEIRAIENASHILTCSERDRDVILEHVPGVTGRVSVVPNCVDFEAFDNYARQYTPKHNDVPKVLFIGTYGYDPNIDALHSICNIIAPGAGPGVQFITAGKNPPVIPHPDNVLFPGYVDNLQKAILDCDICIAPLRHGSGTRFKILEYMSLGKPVISTTKGAEGIDYTEGENIIIEDDLTRYPELIRELVDDERRMNRIGSNARELIRKKYAWTRYEGELRKIYESVAGGN